MPISFKALCISLMFIPNTFAPFCFEPIINRVIRTTNNKKGKILKKIAAPEGKKLEMLSIKMKRAHSGKINRTNFPRVYSIVIIFKPLALFISCIHGRKKPANTSSDPQKPGDLIKSAGRFENVYACFLRIRFLSLAKVGTAVPQKVQNLLSTGMLLPQLEQYIIFIFFKIKVKVYGNILLQYTIIIISKLYVNKAFLIQQII